MFEPQLKESSKILNSPRVSTTEEKTARRQKQHTRKRREAVMSAPVFAAGYSGEAAEGWGLCLVLFLSF